MIGNIKRTFLSKTGLQEKQVLQDPGYVKDVRDSWCMLCAENVEDFKDIKTSHNRFLADFLEFISLLSKMCTNYNVDSNMKSSNYSKIQLKGLIYFELQESSNKNFELKPLRIRYQLNAL